MNRKMYRAENGEALTKREERELRRELRATREAMREIGMSRREAERAIGRGLAWDGIEEREA